MMLKLVLLAIRLLHKNPLAYAENITAYVVLAAEQVGSSPPVRGIFDCSRLGFALNRFNPAYAGNMLRLSRATEQQKVQPRVCGEYPATSQESNKWVGSTPRMRGIYSHSIYGYGRPRFNPAYAGNILCG